MAEDVQRFYAKDPLAEWKKLETPYSHLAFLSTIRLIKKYFPAQGKAIDVGGGPGRYSIELLKRGYQTTLFDLTQEQLKIAQQQMAAIGLEADEIVQGDARDMGFFANNLFDAGLLMGPLYHLSSRESAGQFLSGSETGRGRHYCVPECLGPYPDRHGRLS